MVGPGRHLPLLRPLLEATTASYVQYTDHRITVHQQSQYSIMASVVRTLMPRSLRYSKKVYHCSITINVKAFPPFQLRIDSTKTQFHQTTRRPSHKLSCATISYLVAVEQGQLTVGCAKAIQPPIIASDETDVRQRGEIPSWQSKCENRTATLSDISVLVFVCFSVGCCFLRFSDYFPVVQVLAQAQPSTSGFAIISQVFFRVLASGPRTVVGGNLLAMFSTLTQSSSYAND